jgi:hypothetical protein
MRTLVGAFCGPIDFGVGALEFFWMKEVWFARSLYVLFGVAALVFPCQLFSSCSSNQFNCLTASFELVIAAERSAARLEAENLMLVVGLLTLFAENADMMPAPFLRRLIPWPASLSEAES